MTNETDRVDRLPDPASPGVDTDRTPSRRRQNRMARDVASELDIEREGVGTVERIRGLDVFLRSEGTAQFGSEVADDFASGADYVEPGDVAPNVDADAISASPTVATGRRDDVADRAREGAAADDEFAQPGDFAAEVGPRGVASLGFTDQGRRRRAGRALEAQTPLADVDPTADLEASGDGFALDDQAARRSAARGFEDDLAGLGQGSLDAGADVRALDSGFGLAEEPAREAAAERLDAQLSEVSIGPGDIELSRADDGTFEASFSQGGGN